MSTRLDAVGMLIAKSDCADARMRHVFPWSSVAVPALNLSRTKLGFLTVTLAVIL